MMGFWKWFGWKARNLRHIDFDDIRIIIASFMNTLGVVMMIISFYSSFLLMRLGLFFGGFMLNIYAIYVGTR